MKGSDTLPGLDELKTQAKRLRSTLQAQGTIINHSKALELLARQHGFRDWNTLHAAIGNRPPATRLKLGDRVYGHYLGQPFEGKVLGVQDGATAGRQHVTFLFDAPVDVVKFDSFSAFRQRVSCIVGRTGTTVEKTSDGRPQLSLWT